MFCKCHQYQITHLSLFKWCFPFINMTLLFYYACFCAQLCVRRSSALLVTRQYAALYDRAHVYRICGPAASTAQVSGVSVVFFGGEIWDFTMFFTCVWCAGEVYVRRRWSEGLPGRVSGQSQAGTEQEQRDEGEHQEVSWGGQKTRRIRSTQASQEEICTYECFYAAYELELSNL